MAFGLFEGSIEVKTDRPSYSRGDTINCSCVLKLKQSREARGLRASFKRVEGSGKRRRIISLYQKELGPSRTYRDGERFEFSFPVDEAVAPDIIRSGGLVGILSNLASRRRMYWVISVSLDMPMKLDISGSVIPAINRPTVQK